jgi:WD40 repeat protein/serine/threonine protein kinase
MASVAASALLDERSLKGAGRTLVEMLPTGTDHPRVPRTRSRMYGRPVRFRVLGPLEVFGGNGPLPLGGPKQRTLLAHLVLNANQVVPADRLVDAVWGEDLPEDPRATLQVYVSRLRSALGPEAIEGRAPGYVLRAEPDEVDALRFEAMVAEVRRAPVEPRTIVLTLQGALELWRGPALADLASEPSLTGEIARLEELRLQALEEKVAAELDLGHDARVIAELETLTRTHPLRERLWGELMLALYRSDRQAEALAAFDRARTTLSDELGIDPSHELRSLHERILRQNPDLELEGEPLRGYRLLEQIGEGAFGVVHRAAQPQIGREVAIKAVPPELANHPDFVRRFEREAQIVAKLEHPHIVPLYDYWREPDAAYLVMRFLRGGSLEEQLETGPLDPDRAASILDQVAAALSAAHRQGVVHRDVKPGNVLLDEEGNAYLTDFGVALDAGSPERSTGTMLRGTPEYLSPEQVRLDPASPQTDVYALGIVAYEMVTGVLPFPEASLRELLDRHLRDPIPSVREIRPELPAAVDRVIAKATAKDAARRFDEPLELAAAFRAAIEGTTSVAEPAAEIRNPYKGLRAFLEADAPDFFGRETLTARLLHRLEEGAEASRFLAVVGPSGSGKSSVVRAGLVPVIRRGALEGSERWYVIDLLPGSHPIRELESALLALAVEPPPSLLDMLEGDTLGLVRATEQILPDPDAELLIVLDQLEEVFTLVEDEDERLHVLECLRAAVTAPESRIRLITTLRADFFDQPLSVRGFGDLLAERTEAITPLSPEELERAIVAPADRAGLSVEPRLLAAMIADVVDRPGTLPLLQYALTELAERRDDGVLTLTGYRRIGGVSGALARRAEQIFGAMHEGAREACRQLFLRLVTLGEGSDDTRHRVQRSELLSLAERHVMEGVIDAFGHHRLLSFDRDPATREPTVEIAHEALLKAWDRFRDWIDEAREDIRAQRRLAFSVAEWEAADRDPSFLLRGSRLDQVEAWAGTTTIAISDADRDYVDESSAVQRAALERERTLERRSIRRLRSLVALGVAAALIATSLALIAADRGQRAEREATVATARELAAASVSSLDADTERSLLLALEAVETTRRADGTVLPEAEEALHLALQQHRLVLTVPGYRGRFSDDGSLLLVMRTRGEQQTGDTEPDSEVGVYDAKTGNLLTTAKGPGGGGASFSGDGDRFATAGWGIEPDAHVLNTATGEELFRLDIPHAFAIRPVVFSPDGRLLATAGDDDHTYVWDLGSGELANDFKAAGPLAFSPDGERLLIADSFWDLPLAAVVVDPRERARDRAVATLVEDPQVETDAGAWSPDGSILATSAPEAVSAWDAATYDRRFTLFPPAGTFTAVDVGPDSRLATGMSDGTAIVWAFAEEGARPILTLAGHDAAVQSVSFSPDGTRLMTGGRDGSIKVWDITPERSSEWLTVEGSGAVAFSPDGRLLAAGSEMGEISIFEAAGGRRLQVLRGHREAVNAIAFDPDGSKLASASNDGTARVWETSTGEELARVDERFDEVWDVTFSPDGSTLATGSWSGNSTHTWDAETGALLRTYPENANDAAWPRSVDFSRDGTLVAGEEFTSARVWSVQDGRILAELPQPLVNALAFSPDGKRLLTGADDGTIRVWDPRTGRQLDVVTRNLGEVTDLVFSPDGTTIATSSTDGTVRLWDARTLEPIMTLATNAGGLRRDDGKIAFSPDGTRLAYTAQDGMVRVLALDIDDLVDLARSRLTRPWTQDECRTYLHVGACPGGI